MSVDKINFKKGKGLICAAFTILFFIHAQASERRASTFGYNGTDATEALTAALRSSVDTIIVDRQSSNWNIGPITVFDVRDKVIIFESGVILNAIRGRFSDRNAALLRFVRPRNVVINGYGATFRMDRSEYLGFDTNTEFRHSLAIAEGDNMTVRGLTLEESGGDGVYIVGGSGREYSRNILIEDLTVRDHARAGITIISVEGLTVRNCSFSGSRSNILGVGVNFEPGSSSERIVGTRFENCRFFENFDVGIQISLFNLNRNSTPIGIVFEDCHLTDNSFQNPNRSREILFGVGNSFNNGVTGELTFDGLEVDNARGSVIYSRKPVTAFQVNFLNSTFRNVQGTSGNPILLETPSYSVSTPPLGGFNFDNVRISYASSNSDPFFFVRGWNTMPSLDNVRGRFVIANSGINPNEAIEYRRVTEFNNVDVRFQVVSELPGEGGGGSGTPSNNCNENVTVTESETSATSRSASNTLRATNLVNHPSGIVRYTAGNRVVFSPGFRATSGSGGRFVSEIGDCVPAATSLVAKGGFEYQWDPLAQQTDEDNETVEPVLYPNPIIDRSTISFLLRQDDYVSVNIYDIQYQRVKSIVNNTFMTEGQQELTLDLSSLPQGLYFVSIEGSTEKQTVKAIKK